MDAAVQQFERPSDAPELDLGSYVPEGAHSFIHTPLVSEDGFCTSPD